MTEKRPIREQIATHDYKRSMSTSAAGSVPTRRRVVTIADAGPRAAWNEYVERRNRLYAERSRMPQAQTQTKMTPRTFAQTGTQAPGGQLRTIKRLPRYQSTQNTQGPPVPVRSGRRN